MAEDSINDEEIDLKFWNFRINFLIYFKLKKIKGIKMLRRNNNRYYSSLSVFKEEGYSWNNIFVDFIKFFKENGIVLYIEKIHPGMTCCFWGRYPDSYIPEIAEEE